MLIAMTTNKGGHSPRASDYWNPWWGNNELHEVKRNISLTTSQTFYRVNMPVKESLIWGLPAEAVDCSDLPLGRDASQNYPLRLRDPY